MPSLMGSINIIARCARLYRNDKLKRFGIHGTMDSIILHVCRNPGLSQEDIAKKVCIDKSNVTRKLMRLERDGFIRREPCETDRRVQLVYPTDKGKETCEEIRQILREWSASVTEGVSEEQAELILGGLEVMLANARRYVNEREENGE